MAAQGRRIAVLGGGPVGAGIAAVGLLHGARVSLWSRRAETLAKAQATVERVLKSRAKRGELSKPVPEVLERFQVSGAVAEVVRDVEWVVEAVIEDLEVKWAILREAEEAARADCLISTSGSWIPVSEVASGLRQPERFVGTHFYNPPWERRVVETTPGERTSPEYLEQAVQWLGDLGQTPAVLLRDNAGFVGNRVLFRQFEEAILAVREGVAPEAVDAACRSLPGFVFGPCEAMDFVEMDFLERLFRVAVAWGWDPPPEVPEFLAEKLARGEMGPSTGRGFYAYPSRRWELHTLGAGQGAGLDPLRFMAPSVLEAARLVRGGVASAEVVDTVARGCVGWGVGPLGLGRRWGLRRVQEALEEACRVRPRRRNCDDGSLEAVLG